MIALRSPIRLADWAGGLPSRKSPRNSLIKLQRATFSLADLDAYGVAFVSLRDNLDLSTPSGRLMFQIIGAMAEFERSLIQERVRAGLRNAILKGKTLGRPRRIVNGDQIARLREQGASFRQIAEAVGASPGTVRTRLLSRQQKMILAPRKAPRPRRLISA